MRSINFLMLNVIVLSRILFSVVIYSYSHFSIVLKWKHVSFERNISSLSYWFDDMLAELVCAKALR